MFGATVSCSAVLGFGLDFINGRQFGSLEIIWNFLVALVYDNSNQC